MQWSILILLSGRTNNMGGIIRLYKFIDNLSYQTDFQEKKFSSRFTPEEDIYCSMSRTWRVFSGFSADRFLSRSVRLGASIAELVNGMPIPFSINHTYIPRPSITGSLANMPDKADSQCGWYEHSFVHSTCLSIIRTQYSRMFATWLIRTGISRWLHIWLYLSPLKEMPPCTYLLIIVPTSVHVGTLKSSEF